MDDLDAKVSQVLAGKVVRKDLVRKVKPGAPVPVYVLEYLLGRYCATDDPAAIDAGLRVVNTTLAENFIRPNEANKIYDWDHVRQVSVASWSLGVSASLMIGLFLAYANPSTTVATATAAKAATSPHLLILGFVGGICALSYGSWRFWRIGKIYQNYVAALLLLSRLSEIKPFLIRFRSDPESRPWT
jgi:hypothetical protein